MMANEFWLSEQQWSVIEPLLPRNQPGARRVDDRRVISGIIHVLKAGCRWEDCPGGLWALDDDLQSLQPMVPTRTLAAPVRGSGKNGRQRHADDRQHDG